MSIDDWDEIEELCEEIDSWKKFQKVHYAVYLLMFSYGLAYGSYFALTNGLDNANEL